MINQPIGNHGLGIFWFGQIIIIIFFLIFIFEKTKTYIQTAYIKINLST